jgi:hypothetical protein
MQQKFLLVKANKSVGNAPAQELGYDKKKSE